MTLFVITVLVFLISAGLTLSATYFFIQVPAARRQIRLRLQTIQEGAVAGEIQSESQILRDEMLSSIPAINRILLRTPGIPKLQLFLTQAAVTVPIETILLMSAALLFLSALSWFLLGMPALFIPVIALTAATIPFMVIAFRRHRRFAKFAELFPDAIDLLARAVRAGHAFTTGFSLIATEMPEPIASEFRTAFDQQNLGLPLHEALRNLSLRMPLPDVLIFLAALNIQRESGGNLGEVLDNLSHVIRERFRLLRQIQVFTAEGRISLYMLTGIPPVVGILMYFLNPEYMARLFTDPIGRSALGGAVVSQIVGYFVIRWIVRIKV